MKKLLLTGLLMFLLTVPAYTMDLTTMKAVEGRVGVDIAFGDFGDVVDPSIFFGGSFLMGFHTNMAFEGNINYTMFSAAEDIFVDVDYMEVSGGVRYFFMTEGLSPYAAAAVGLYHWSLDADIEDDTGNEFGVNFGGGVMYPFTEKVCLDVGLRFNSVFTEDESSNYVGISGGIAYTF